MSLSPRSSPAGTSGRLERTGCEAWAEALFSDLGAAQAELSGEMDLAGRLAFELSVAITGRGVPAHSVAALALHAARRKDRS